MVRLHVPTDCELKDGKYVTTGNAGSNRNGYHDFQTYHVLGELTDDFRTGTLPTPLTGSLWCTWEPFRFESQGECFSVVVHEEGVFCGQAPKKYWFVFFAPHGVKVRIRCGSFDDVLALAQAFRSQTSCKLSCGTLVEIGEMDAESYFQVTVNFALPDYSPCSADECRPSVNERSA